MAQTYAPTDWMTYDRMAILGEFAAARAALLMLSEIPYQKSWADRFYADQNRSEIRGTLRLAEVDLSEKELEASLGEDAGGAETIPHLQVAATVEAYEWVARVPADWKISEAVVRELHKRLSGPGAGGAGKTTWLGADPSPLESLCEAGGTVFWEHDPLIQAFAWHYHLFAMRAFPDANGRVARAMETLMVRRSGLRDSLLLAMSAYYSEQRSTYFSSLKESVQTGHNLTPFLKFALRGVEVQARRLYADYRLEVARALYLNMASDLFERFGSGRKDEMFRRHYALLKLLIEENGMALPEIGRRMAVLYGLKNPQKALLRDLGCLVDTGALSARQTGEDLVWHFSPNPDWPSQMTPADFGKKLKEIAKEGVKAQFPSQLSAASATKS